MKIFFNKIQTKKMSELLNVIDIYNIYNVKYVLENLGLENKSDFETKKILSIFFFSKILLDKNYTLVEIFISKGSSFIIKTDKKTIVLKIFLINSDDNSGHKKPLFKNLNNKILLTEQKFKNHEKTNEIFNFLFFDFCHYHSISDCLNYFKKINLSENLNEFYNLIFLFEENCEFFTCSYDSIKKMINFKIEDFTNFLSKLLNDLALLEKKKMEGNLLDEKVFLSKILKPFIEINKKTDFNLPIYNPWKGFSTVENNNVYSMENRKNNIFISFLLMTYDLYCQGRTFENFEIRTRLFYFFNTIVSHIFLNTYNFLNKKYLRLDYELENLDQEKIFISLVKKTVNDNTKLDRIINQIRKEIFPIFMTIKNLIYKKIKEIEKICFSESPDLEIQVKLDSNSLLIFIELTSILGDEINPSDIFLEKNIEKTAETLYKKFLKKDSYLQNIKEKKLKQKSEFALYVFDLSYSIDSEDLKKHRNLTSEYLKKNKNDFPNSKIRKELINALENDNNFLITFLYMRYNERNFFM